MGLCISQRDGDTFVIGDSCFKTEITEDSLVRFTVDLRKRPTRLIDDSEEYCCSIIADGQRHSVTIIPYNVHAASCSLNIIAPYEVKIRRIDR